jgi:hypothetical protein
MSFGTVMIPKGYSFIRRDITTLTEELLFQVAVKVNTFMSLL